MEPGGSQAGVWTQSLRLAPCSWPGLCGQHRASPGKGTRTHLPPSLLPLKGRASPAGDWTRSGLQVWTGVRNTLVPGVESPFPRGPGTAAGPPPEEGLCGQHVKPGLEPTGPPARPDPCPHVPSALSALPSTRTSPGLSLLPSWPVMSLAWAGLSLHLVPGEPAAALRADVGQHCGGPSLYPQGSPALHRRKLRLGGWGAQLGDSGPDANQVSLPGPTPQPQGCPASCLSQESCPEEPFSQLWGPHAPPSPKRPCSSCWLLPLQARSTCVSPAS